MRLPLILALASTLVAAQDFRERPRRPERKGEGLAQAAPMLMQVRVQRIQETLRLPDAQAKALAERWARYDADFIHRSRDLGALRTRFNDILLGPGSEDEKNAQLKPLVEQFLDLRKQQAELKARFEDDIRVGLSSAQQVRLILLVDELQQRLREGIREAMRERRGQGKNF